MQELQNGTLTEEMKPTQAGKVRPAKLSALIDAFKQGLDIHTATAARLYSTNWAGVRIPASPAGFFDLRDRVFVQRRARLALAHARERRAYEKTCSRTDHAGSPKNKADDDN